MANSSSAKPQLAHDPLLDIVSLDEICRIAREVTGVQLSERHRSMVGSRLQARLSELGLADLKEYLAYYKSHREQENPKFIALLTTHHTYFFREFSHFEYLLSHALPKLVPIVRARPDKTLRLWSAACSRGQEAYSLAMFLDYHLKRMDPSLKFHIQGTDIDAESVEIARNGVYARKELKEAPLSLLGDHWAKGTGEIADFVKAKKSLRGQCDFGSANLLERKSMPSTQFDIIFCRNVFIYFNSDQIKAITTGLLEHLNPEGFLFIGISETLNSLGLPVSTLGPSVYQHRALKPAPAPGASTATGKSPVAPSAPLPAIAALPNPIRVVCVDDSPSILTLMKQILTKEHGFEIVGTASSGLDAAQKIPALKPHAITLDIHMPEQTGIEYLEKNHRPGHPAVVMVSSVSREDAGLALRALTAGASDYVEKPALGNIQERGDEIRTKLRCAVQAGQMASAPSKALDKEFATAKRIEHPEKKLRVLILPLSARTRLQAIFKDVKASGEPPTLILIEGSPQAMASFNGEISKLTSRSTLLLDKLPDGGTLKADQIYCADFKTVFADLHTAHAKTPTSLLVLGEVSQHAAREIQAWRAGQKGNRAQLVLEDLGGNQGCKALMASASDVVPATSFIYLSCEFLCKPAK